MKRYVKSFEPSLDIVPVKIGENMKRNELIMSIGFIIAIASFMIFGIIFNMSILFFVSILSLIFIIIFDMLTDRLEAKT